MMMTTTMMMMMMMMMMTVVVVVVVVVVNWRCCSLHLMWTAALGEPSPKGAMASGRFPSGAQTLVATRP